DVGHQRERSIEFSAGIAHITIAPAHVHLAEVAGSADLILLRQLLIAYAQYDVIVERITQRPSVSIIQRHTEIDARYFRAKSVRQRSDFEFLLFDSERHIDPLDLPSSPAGLTTQVGFIRLAFLKYRTRVNPSSSGPSLFARS